MLEQGLAWTERHKTKLKMPGWIEDGANSKKRGLWADPDPTPPWEFRKNNTNH